VEDGSFGIGSAEKPVRARPDAWHRFLPRNRAECLWTVGDEGSVLLFQHRERTTVRQEWIAGCLNLKNARNVSQRVRRFRLRLDGETSKLEHEWEKKWRNFKFQAPTPAHFDAFAT